MAGPSAPAAAPPDVDRIVTEALRHLPLTLGPFRFLRPPDEPSDEQFHYERIGALLWSPDGRTLWTAHLDQTLRQWSAVENRELRRTAIQRRHPETHLSIDDRPGGLALSADGRSLFTTIGSQIICHDAGPLGERFRLDVPPLPKDPWPSLRQLFLSPRGDRIVADARYDQVVVWDLPKERPSQVLRQEPGPRLIQPKEPIFPLDVTADGRIAASCAGDGLVVLWDLETGRQLRRFEADGRSGHSLAIAPDGRRVATAKCFRLDGTWVDRIDLWEPDVPLPPRHFGHRAACLRFSTDGKLLAAVSDTQLLLIEAVSGDELAMLWAPAPWRWFHRYEGGGEPAQFAPDGRTLAVGKLCGRVLLWDLRPALPAAPRPLDRLWDDLIARPALPAWRAAWELIARPDEAVALLRQRVRPVPAVAPAQLRRWVAELDDDDYDAREAAGQALRDCDEQGRTLLVEGYRTNDSPEFRRRAEELFIAHRDAPGRLRAARATMVLEQIGSPAAKALLREWAGGGPGAVLTREAEAAFAGLEAAAAAATARPDDGLPGPR